MKRRVKRVEAPFPYRLTAVCDRRLCQLLLILVLIHLLLLFLLLFQERQHVQSLVW